MTLTQLKQKLVYYFQQAGVSPGFMQNSDDMILLALNMARLRAEQLHAFELNRLDISYPSVSEAVVWTTGTIWPDGGLVRVRNLKRVFYLTGSSLVEIPLEYANLVPQDCSERRAYLKGAKLFFRPGLEAQDLVVDGYRWMDDYTTYDDSDWLVENGWSYLFWACVQDLNMRFKEFVPRQEGNLPVSEMHANEELQKLIAWNNQLKHGGFNLL